MLTQTDIEALLKNRSSQSQIEVIDKIVTQYVSDGADSFNDEQRAIANSIFTLLLEHAEADVRASLANSLSSTDKLPLEIAKAMASDVNSVAASILENSPIFKDEDLLTFIRLDSDVRKLEAIASRAHLSEAVSDSLVETKIASVSEKLGANDGAEIADHTFEKIVELHRLNQDVMSSLFQRSRLPSKVVKYIVERISDTMRKDLEGKYGDLSEQQELQGLLNKSIERVTLRILGFESTDTRLMQLLKLMDGSKKLTPFLALGTARLELFEIALARQLYVPLQNVRILLADPNGLRRAYEAAKLPDYMFPVTEITMGLIRALEKESMAQHGDLRLCTPHALQQKIAAHSRREIPGMEYITALLQKNSLGDVYLESHRN